MKLNGFLLTYPLGNTIIDDPELVNQVNLNTEELKNKASIKDITDDEVDNPTIIAEQAAMYWEKWTE